MLQNRHELALVLGEQLAASEMRYFMAAKIGVALLLGVSTVGVALETIEHGAAGVLDTAAWVMVGCLLVLFVTFIFQVVTLIRRTLSRTASGES